MSVPGRRVRSISLHYHYYYYYPQHCLSQENEIHKSNHFILLSCFTHISGIAWSCTVRVLRICVHISYTVF